MLPCRAWHLTGPVPSAFETTRLALATGIRAAAHEPTRLDVPGGLAPAVDAETQPGHSKKHTGRQHRPRRLGGHSLTTVSETIANVGKNSAFFLDARFVKKGQYDIARIPSSDNS